MNNLHAVFLSTAMHCTYLLALSQSLGALQIALTGSQKSARVQDLAWILTLRINKIYYILYVWLRTFIRFTVSSFSSDGMLSALAPDAFCIKNALRAAQNATCPAAGFSVKLAATLAMAPLGEAAWNLRFPYVSQHFALGLEFRRVSKNPLRIQPWAKRCWRLR